MYKISAKCNHRALSLLLAIVLDEDPRPAPIIHQGPQNQTLPINSIALMQCLATGEPPPSVRWYRNGRPLSLRDQRFTLLHSGTLQISGDLSREILELKRENLVGKDDYDLKAFQ